MRRTTHQYTDLRVGAQQAKKEKKINKAINYDSEQNRVALIFEGVALRIAIWIAQKLIRIGPNCFRNDAIYIHYKWERWW